MARARGVDISSVQARCDFEALARGGFDFAIPKMTQGAIGKDPTFAQHIEGARAAGLLVPLAYHVLSPKAPVAQQIMNALEVSHYYDVDIALDFELSIESMTVGQRVMQALTFADAVIAKGKKCVVYSYPNFMRGLRGASSLALLANITEYWAADYPSQRKEPAEGAHPWTPEAWGGRWLCWQWSGDGGTGAPGIPQIVDHDIWNGSREDMLNWMRGNKGESAPGSPSPAGPANTPPSSAPPVIA